jgi:hypothetical protein
MSGRAVCVCVCVCVCKYAHKTHYIRTVRIYIIITKSYSILKMNLTTFTFTEEPRHIDLLTVHRVGKMVIVDGKRKRIFSNKNDGEFFTINKIPFYAMDSRMYPPSVFVVCPWRVQCTRTHADYFDDVLMGRRMKGASTRTQLRETDRIKGAFKFMMVYVDCEHYKKGGRRPQLLKPLRHVPPPSTFSEILGQVKDKTWAIEYHMAQLLANLPPAPVVAPPVVAPLVVAPPVVAPLVVAPTTTRTPTKKPAKGYRIKACNRSGYGGQYLSPERLAIDARCALRVAKYNLLHQPTPTVPPPTVPTPTIQPPTATKKRPWQIKKYRYPPMGSDDGRIMYYMVRNGFTPCAESVEHPFGLKRITPLRVVHP